jgi:hypothetical protein
MCPLRPRAAQPQGSSSTGVVERGERVMRYEGRGCPNHPNNPNNPNQDLRLSADSAAEMKAFARALEAT